MRGVLNLSLPKVPNLKAVGGNARHGHPMERARAMAAEKEEWLALIREAVGPGDKEPMERVSATFVVIFPWRRRRDYDNLIAALKPCFDALVTMGLLADDDTEHVTSLWVQALNDKSVGPMTDIFLKAE